MATSVQLGDLKVTANAAIVASEQNLYNKLQTIQNGDTVSGADLLGYQMELMSNSLTISTASSIAKERGDTLKSVVQKF